MANMRATRVPMLEQAPDIRNKNFDEVALGYDAAMATEEAARCLQCKNPLCVQGCPVNVQIPAFLKEIAAGDFAAANRIVRETNALPAVCGRVCPQENQCEGRCVRGIKGEAVAIGRLERFCADWARQHGEEPPVKATPNGKKVAIVGGGPAGLTCAGDLAKRGYAVTVFEAMHVAGGVLVYGIPEFRLPKEVVRQEIETLKALGVTIETDMVIGRVLSIDELMEQGFEAVFIGSGAGLPQFMGIEGENGVGVYSANEFLTRVNLMKAYRDDYITPIHRAKTVAVVGGGNVAMDAARCAKRLGAETVYIVYRRSEEEMPARKEEVHHAKEEGIVFQLLTNPTRILTDEEGRVTGMDCVEMALSEPDASGRRRPVPIEGSDFVLPVDSVIMALGTSPNPLLRATTAGLSTNSRGCLIVDERMHTTRDNVWAGGDAVTGAATVILAMGAGKSAAKAIDETLRGE